MARKKKIGNFVKADMVMVEPEEVEGPCTSGRKTAAWLLVLSTRCTSWARLTSCSL